MTRLGAGRYVFARFQMGSYAAKKKKRVTVKEMKFRHDPLVRLYEKTEDWLQNKGRPVAMAAIAIMAALLISTGIYYLIQFREERAAEAAASAFEKYNAPVLESPPSSPTGKYYTDEKTKWQEAAAAFEQLARDYPGYYGAIGRYYAGVCYLRLDRNKGLQLLQEAANRNEQPTSDLARLAMAENYTANGELDKAIQIYESLLKSRYVPAQAVQFGLANAYEKKGDLQKAVEAYFEAARMDRASSLGSDAEKKLSALAPNKLKELPPPNQQAAP